LELGATMIGVFILKPRTSVDMSTLSDDTAGRSTMSTHSNACRLRRMVHSESVDRAM
jgi:hypothetical protein